MILDFWVVDRGKHFHISSARLLDRQLIYWAHVLGSPLVVDRYYECFPDFRICQPSIFHDFYEFHSSMIVYAHFCRSLELQLPGLTLLGPFIRVRLMDQVTCSGLHLDCRRPIDQKLKIINSIFSRNWSNSNIHSMLLGVFIYLKWPGRVQNIFVIWAKWPTMKEKYKIFIFRRFRDQNDWLECL